MMTEAEVGVIKFKDLRKGPGQVVQLFGGLSHTPKKVVGLIPSQDSDLGCWSNSWSGNIQEATN